MQGVAFSGLTALASYASSSEDVRLRYATLHRRRPRMPSLHRSLRKSAPAGAVTHSLYTGCLRTYVPTYLPAALGVLSEPVSPRECCALGMTLVCGRRRRHTYRRRAVRLVATVRLRAVPRPEHHSTLDRLAVQSIESTARLDWTRHCTASLTSAPVRCISNCGVIEYSSEYPA